MKLSDLVSHIPLSKAQEFVVTQLQSWLESLGYGDHISINTSHLKTPPPNVAGDVAFGCFPLAKEMKKGPNEIAIFLKDKFTPHGIFAAAEAVGPYLNLSLDRAKFAQLVLEEILDEDGTYGKSTAGKGQKVMIEYSSPNTNKPQHLGHVRNNLLGWSAARLLEALGFQVIKSSIVNDRGIHICKSMLAYQKWGNGMTPESSGKKPDHLVGDFYVMFETELKKQHQSYVEQTGINPKTMDDKGQRKFQEDFLAWSPLMQEAQAMLKAWEDGDPEVVSLWKKMNGWVYQGFDQTYAELGVDFDRTYYESDIYKGGRDIINQAVERGKLIRREDGSVIAPLQENFGMPDKVVLRGDGTSLYVTQDLNLAHEKFSDFDLDFSIYCIANEQDLYMQQLIKVLELIGFAGAERMYHMSYGMVNLPEGKMKSREGTVVDADDFMAEMTDLAAALLKERYSDLDDQELAKRSKAIGLAAIKFFMLCVKRASSITFDPKKSIAFEGKTGPYLLYTYARAASVLRKINTEATKPDVGYGDYTDTEWALVKVLADFHQYVYFAAVGCEPAILADHLYEIAQLFNQFYHSDPIIRAEGQTQSVRVALTKAAQQVLANGLAMLGIITLDEM